MQIMREYGFKNLSTILALSWVIFLWYKNVLTSDLSGVERKCLHLGCWNSHKAQIAYKMDKTTMTLCDKFLVKS